MVTVIVISVVFTACNKELYVDPSTGVEYLLVVDENGEKVLNADGELLVYVTDADGKKTKDADGNYVTEVHGFIGQIEQNGVVEDYAYYFKLPGGWSTVSDRGEFENKLKNYSLEIEIKEKTFNDYYAKTGQIAKAVTSPEFNEQTELDWDAEWYELDYDDVDTKVCLLMMKANDTMTSTMFFSESENLYVIQMTSSIDSDFDKIKEEMLGIFEALEFKPYTYYEGLTDAPTEADEETTEKVEDLTSVTENQ